MIPKKLFDYWPGDISSELKSLDDKDLLAVLSHMDNMERGRGAQVVTETLLRLFAKYVDEKKE